MNNATGPILIEPDLPSGDRLTFDFPGVVSPATWLSHLSAIIHDPACSSTSGFPQVTSRIEVGMAQHMVKCVKLGRELPGLDEPPWGGELGQRIYDNVSEQAWDMWVEHMKMLINEFRLNPSTPEAQELIAREMEQFFFGQGAAPPPDYVPQKG